MERKVDLKSIDIDSDTGAGPPKSMMDITFQTKGSDTFGEE